MKEKIKQVLSKHFDLPGSSKIKDAMANFTLTEKTLFYSLVAILLISSLSVLWKVNQSFMVAIPGHGGTLTEGVIGLPRFINPVLAFSDADRDLTALTYSGLLKATPEGTLLPDLAESYTISENGLVYSFTLKKNLVFQDGTPITADDVVFTIQKAQDPAIKSPKRPNWEGVTVEKAGDLQVKLTLKQPYSPFLENTTLGILPKHIWNNANGDEFQFSQFNIEPIGSGPYKLKSIERNSSGIPVSYHLISFKNYADEKPYISNLVIKFYQNNNDLITAHDNGLIDNLANISPKQANEIDEKGGLVERTPLPRIFAVFFNQNHAPIFANKEVREALSIMTDKNQIVEAVLNGDGIAIDSPIPPGLIQKEEGVPVSIYKDDTERIAAAKKVLESGGWKFNKEKQIYEKTVKKVTTPLSFSISTSNAQELKSTADLLKTMWEKVGAQVEVKVFDIGELNQNVIRTRKYDALLFGEIIGRDLDLFAFWHSSQRNDPGLNIAMYTSTTADKLLEEARATTDRDVRIEKYLKLEEEIKDSLPAIFIYSPDFLYVVSPNIKGINLGHVTIPAERFLGIDKWYLETEHIWKIFAPKN